MISRALTIALVISLGVHIFAMSMVTIVTPEGRGRMKPYTRVDFLGPILKKTAFDIMLENVKPVFTTTYQVTGIVPQSGYLKVVVPKRKATLPEMPKYFERNMDSSIEGFLTGDKIVPDLDFGFSTFTEESWKEGASTSIMREVIYKPEAPLIMSGVYGDKDVFRVKVKVLISPSGNVKKTESVTTTGYPQLDITAFKFVKGWIFEPKEGAIGDEWQEVEVVLRAED